MIDTNGPRQDPDRIPDPLVGLVGSLSLEPDPTIEDVLNILERMENLYRRQVAVAIGIAEALGMPEAEVLRELARRRAAHALSSGLHRG